MGYEPNPAEGRLDKWIGRPFELLANLYVVALFAVGLGSIVLTVAAALIYGAWWALLILLLPAFWLLMWRTS